MEQIIEDRNWTQVQQAMYWVFQVSWYTTLLATDCSDECYKFMNVELEKNVACIGRGMSVART